MFHVKQINQAIDVSRETIVAKGEENSAAPSARRTLSAPRDHVLGTTRRICALMFG
jgi:hypothetical protein